MATTVIEGIEGLRSRLGEELGVSDWHTVAKLSSIALRRRPRTATSSTSIPSAPGRRPVSTRPSPHGLLTLALGPMFSYEIFEVVGVGSALNYGYDKVRFIAPLPVGSKVRMRLLVERIEETDRGVRVRFRQTFEAHAAEKPACIADWVLFYWLAGFSTRVPVAAPDS
jgi:hypothetical protein